MKKITLLTLFACASLAVGCRSNLTGETAGQIKSVALDRDVKTSRKKTSSNKRKKKTNVSYETEIEYSYSVGGKNYEGYSEKDGDVQRDFRAGSPVVVCYNPADPEESDVFAAGTKCG
ncbi:MAG TPA: DUF3592 domain-containing protein [Pyrinomonadaceae bacterium]|jgi:hypothetical protein